MTIAENKTFKVVLLGSTYVGKTAIVERLINNDFSGDSETTIGVEFRTYPVNVGDTEVKLNIWDTAGQEKFRSVSKAYFRNALGAILVFSLTDLKSFEALDDWLNDLQSLSAPNASIMMFGNKLDLKSERVVPEEEAKLFASRHDLEYVETSALDSTNIKESFTRLAKQIYEKVSKGEIQGTFQTSPRQVVLNESQSAKSEEQKGGCGC